MGTSKEEYPKGTPVVYCPIKKGSAVDVMEGRTGYIFMTPLPGSDMRNYWIKFSVPVSPSSPNGEVSRWAPATEFVKAKK